ncbi:hypothetical protein BLNAU_2189 [Blattamonas nauphoetae]|uniref:Myb-like domain-containing protein n=1 Tax=Blattamonas nauphoetae TaxID=2049346 RepID=A0ABQ9YG77_9EUKA|nr:hypothetical protein BLNAU_2189 [Blattamonas nauphoetae]
MNSQTTKNWIFSPRSLWTAAEYAPIVMEVLEELGQTPYEFLRDHNRRKFEPFYERIVDEDGDTHLQQIIKFILTDINSGRWTDEEEKTLLHLVETVGPDFQGIAEDMCRTTKSVRRKYSELTRDVNESTWSQEEISKLIRLIREDKANDSGRKVIDWNSVANKHGTRTALQCSNYYYSQLHQSTLGRFDLVKNCYADLSDINWPNISHELHIDRSSLRQRLMRLRRRYCELNDKPIAHSALTTHALPRSVNGDIVGKFQAAKPSKQDIDSFRAQMQGVLKMVSAKNYDPLFVLRGKVRSDRPKRQPKPKTEKANKEETPENEEASEWEAEELLEGRRFSSRAVGSVVNQLRQEQIQKEARKVEEKKKEEKREKTQQGINSFLDSVAKVGQATKSQDDGKLTQDKEEAGKRVKDVEKMRNEESKVESDERKKKEKEERKRQKRKEKEEKRRKKEKKQRRKEKKERKAKEKKHHRHHSDTQTDSDSDSNEPPKPIQKTKRQSADDSSDD